MGLKHRRTAGTASHDIQPLFDSSESGLIPAAEIQRRLQSVPAADAAEAETAACSDFKAAALPRRLSTQMGQYDVAGVAAAICRHEHVLAWCDLQGAENFSYYDALVERCMTLLGGGGLAIFFVDIGCDVGRLGRLFPIAFPLCMQASSCKSAATRHVCNWTLAWTGAQRRLPG